MSWTLADRPGLALVQFLLGTCIVRELCPPALEKKHPGGHKIGHNPEIPVIAEQEEKTSI